MHRQISNLFERYLGPLVLEVLLQIDQRALLDLEGFSLGLELGLEVLQAPHRLILLDSVNSILVSDRYAFLSSV